MHKTRLRTGVATAMTASAMMVGSLALCGSAALAATAAGCQPGSGPQLAGQRFTKTQITEFTPGHLRCANLTGAHLGGLSLIQIDLTGAILKNADLSNADLTQATLDDANLSGANLTDANMSQASVKHANLTGANLTGVDLTQADLTDANLSKTKLSGTQFVQATMDNTSFEGATGVAPWYLFIALAAVLFLAILAIGSIRRGVKSLGPGGGNAGLVLAFGLIGSLVVAIGFNLTVGGFIGEIVSASGPPVTQTCQAGLVCTVGVSSGFIGIFGGVLVMIGGFVLRGRGRRSNAPAQQAWSGQF